MSEQTTSTVIARWRGNPDALRFAEYALSDAHFESLRTATTEVLKVFPPTAGACVMMSALLVERLRSLGVTTAFAIAGDLHVPGGRVFGEDREPDWSSVFSQCDLSWGGHCWVAVGGWLADTSVYRTAYSENAPPLLAAHLREPREKRPGALVCTEEAAIDMDLNYVPRYALSDDETTILARSALHLIS